MLTNKQNPVEYALLLHELDDARDHLQRLVNELSAREEDNEIHFRIQLAHIYAHLNRAWNSRNQTGERTDEQFDRFSRFPDDLESE